MRVTHLVACFVRNLFFNFFYDLLLNYFYKTKNPKYLIFYLFLILFFLLRKSRYSYTRKSNIL